MIIRRGLIAVCMLCAMGVVGCESPVVNQESGPAITTATPPAGTYPIAKKTAITLKTSHPATVYLTLDGTQPRVGSPNTFALRAPVSGIPIAFNGMALRYFSIDDQGNQEQPQIAVYNLDGPPVTSVKPAAGLYANPVTVTLTADEEATVYYTTDGSEPDPANPNAKSGESPLGGISILRSTNLRFASQDAVGNLEKTKSASFQIDTQPPEVLLTPAPGTYDSPLAVEITITNDTGWIYYTVSDSDGGGGIPKENDSTGKTKQQAGTLKLTLNKTTTIRYLVTDKVGNREADLPAEGYKEVVYYMDCKPAVVANPGGGAYPGQTLTIVVEGQPAGTIYYKKDNGLQKVYSTPLIITNVPGAEFEFWNDAALDGSCGSSVRSSDHVFETYTLGADIPSYVYSEEFTSDTWINAGETTAAVVTSGNGTVELPFRQAEIHERELNDTVHAGLSPTLAQTKFFYDAVYTRWIVAGVEGIPGVLPFDSAPAVANTDRNMSGLKIYTAADLGTDTATISYVSSWRPSIGPFTPPRGAPVLFDLGFVYDSSSKLYAATVMADKVGFVELTDLAAPVVVTAQIDIVSATPQLLTRNDDPDRIYVFSASGGSNTLIGAYDFEDPDVNPASVAELTLPNATAVDVILDDDDSAGGSSESGAVVLASTCSVFRIDLGASGSTTLALKGGNNDISVCSLQDNEIPVKVTSFQAGGMQYVFATVAGQGNNGKVAMIRLSGDTVDEKWLQVLPENLDGLQIGGIEVIPVQAGAAGYVLAVAVGSDLYLYDLGFDAANPSLLENLTAAGRLPFLSRISAGNRGLSDLYGIASGYMVGALADIAGGGGVALMRVPHNVKTRVGQAVVTSLNINPDSGREVQAIHFQEEERNSVGFIDYEVKFGSGLWQSLTPGNSLPVSTSTDGVFWRATLTRGGTATDEPVLDRLQIKLSYPEEQ